MSPQLCCKSLEAADPQETENQKPVGGVRWGVNHLPGAFAYAQCTSGSSANFQG